MARLPVDLLPTAPWNRHWPLLAPAVGRRLKWRLGRGPVSFTLQSVSVAPGLSGRLREVRLSATDVDVDHVRLDRADVVARDVRLTGAFAVTGSVELTVRLGQAGLDALVDGGMPYAKLRLEGGVGVAELAGHPRWGRVEVRPDVVDGDLLLRPTAVRSRSGRRWPGPARLLPQLRIGSDVLLPGSRVLAAAVHDDHLDLTAELDEIRLPLVAF